jgi:hypothetical protein
MMMGLDCFAEANFRQTKTMVSERALDNDILLCIIMQRPTNKNASRAFACWQRGGWQLAACLHLLALSCFLAVVCDDNWTDGRRPREEQSLFLATLYSNPFFIFY